jgi:uncharacterized protein YndB with AHSA1/START domain
MATKDIKAETTLRLERTYRAPREAVFKAWTEAKALSRWWGPTDEYTSIVHAVDPRVGGKYRIEMRHVSGGVSIVGGVYRVVEAPSKLVFTFRWEEDKSEAEDTVVTAEFHARGDVTDLVVTHERFVNAEQRDLHLQGWTGTLDRLAKAL